MAKVREVLAASDQLTHGMTSILDSFERRLASLEQTVLPVYHETGNLQRRKQSKSASPEKGAASDGQSAEGCGMAVHFLRRDFCFRIT